MSQEKGRGGEWVAKPAASINGVVFSLSGANYHHFELYEHLASMGLVDDDRQVPQSGFLTDRGRFVDMQEADKIRRGGKAK